MLNNVPLALLHCICFETMSSFFFLNVQTNCTFSYTVLPGSELWKGHVAANRENKLDQLCKNSSDHVAPSMVSVATSVDNNGHAVPCASWISAIGTPLLQETAVIVVVMQLTCSCMIILPAYISWAHA